MGYPMYLVDAFAHAPFTGNSAAVVLLDSVCEDAEWMQKVAEEMKQSETAFVAPEEGGWRLRWFTPAVEVDLCGHATMASAHALWESGRALPENAIEFWTRSGRLACELDRQRIRMDFPSRPPVECELTAALAAVFPGAVWAGNNGMDLLVELESAAAVRTLAPDIRALMSADVRGVIVTAWGEGDHDFVSRFFAPAVGVDEDPVTGSAHCCLAPYWAAKLGKNPLVGYQASARGGFVGVEVLGERVSLSGKAVTTVKGELLW